MVKPRKRPYINVTWLKKYLVGEDLCRWSIWHRIFYVYEKFEKDYNYKANMEHTALCNEVMKRYQNNGYIVTPELEITVYGQRADLHGKIDLVAIREDEHLIIEVKTGKPWPSDRIQLMLYIWALPRAKSKYRGVPFDGLLIYPNHEIEISALDVDEIFVKNFKRFTDDIMSAEPDRKYPTPRECKWCKIANCDERDLSDNFEEEKPDYVSDFF
jgi:hypothetical protein